MEPEGNCVGSNLKRHREPLSDTEDNLLSSELNDVQKRRRLEPSGQENRSPKPSTSGRSVELETKPDTPIVPSVRSRVQLLTSQRHGTSVPQRFLSDPGTNESSMISHDRSVIERLLSEGEFNQRIERFKTSNSQASSSHTQSPSNSWPRTRSGFVSDIQQKLQCTTTPSSKQATLIRQEREQELNLLPFQPISENAWLKMNSSDSSLNQQLCGSEMNDGSFTAAASSEKGKLAGNLAGEPAETHPAIPDEVWELKVDAGEEDGERNETQEEQSESQIISKLSFSQDQSVSELNEAEKQVHFESTFLDESNTNDRSNVSQTSEPDVSDVFTFDEDETLDGSSYGEPIEPSTEEELKMWRYPQHIVDREEQLVVSKGQKKYAEEKMASSTVDEPLDVQHEECPPPGNVSANISVCAEKQKEKKTKVEEECELESCLEESKREKSNFDQYKSESGEYREGKIIETEALLSIPEPKIRNDEDPCEQPTYSQIVDVAELREVIQAASPDSGIVNVGLNSRKITSAEAQEKNPDPGDARDSDEEVKEKRKTEGKETSKKVTFILQPVLLNSDINTESETPAETSLSDDESSLHDETNTAELIEQMFDEVLEYAGRVEAEEKNGGEAEHSDSGIGAFSAGNVQPGKEQSEETEAKKEENDEVAKDESCGDELTFPSCGILSPLSKSVEAVVTPMRLAAALESNPPSLALTPETSGSPVESAPLYSIDAYRTQTQRKAPPIQSITPTVQRRAPETSTPQPPSNNKDKIMALNEEAKKLQTVINQTLQALSCCTDEEHGRGSLEEAEAEKLLLVSCEKRSTLLAEVARLREMRESDEDGDYVSQQPCRGTVSITNIQLPLKLEFVCSSHNRTGRPSHYFFVLIRYGPNNIVATPLATAADAQNGDTISFPTSVTLKDIRSSFEIDVEVYSLSHNSSSNCSTDRTISTKSRVTPKKILNTITRNSNSLTCSGPSSLSTRRSSNFCLVGSHKITLASLGRSKFPLDKMKFEGKVRRLLGDEFQEKVPFLSPLEGNIYLQLDSESHSNVHHQGFLTMFELISGYGVWNRRYFVLEGCSMYYWNHPNEQETKEAEGSVPLSSSPNQCVRPVSRNSCARPFTFELANNVNQQQDSNQEALSKCWFSADTKQECLDWMEKLSQTLLDFQTWNQKHSEELQPNISISGSLRESIL